jgi:hypothetical protein
LALEAFYSLGGEADLGEVYEKLEEGHKRSEADRSKAVRDGRTAYRRQVRSQISSLLQKEQLIRQKRASYSLSFVGRRGFINELAWRYPESPLLKEERKRKSLILPVEV